MYEVETDEGFAPIYITRTEMTEFGMQIMQGADMIRFTPFQLGQLCDALELSLSIIEQEEGDELELELIDEDEGDYDEEDEWEP